jgi:hypothetical protein
MASRAWNAAASLAPNVREKEAYAQFRLKQSGYEAMEAGDWIRAYYIFRELTVLTPNDPDIRNYLVKSENGVREIAFFTDEMDMSLGDILTGAVFSLPVSGAAGVIPGRNTGFPAGGRGVLRISSLSAFPDYAYGIGLEYLSFDGAGRFRARAEADSVKIRPINITGRPRVVVFMHALNRDDKDKHWEPEWTGPDRGDSGGNTQIVLEISYENFILLSELRRGVDNLLIGQLFAARNLSLYGYMPEVFEAELVNRIAFPLFFLPLAILAIIIGWRFRAQKRPRYLFVPMLALLPVVWNLAVLFCRHLLNTLSIWTVISLGFYPAIFIFAGAIAALFIISLISLAAQHG